VLLGVCGELYAALPAPGLASLHKQKVGALEPMLMPSPPHLIAPRVQTQPVSY
jgi:hypothetical protein